jgi:hypothetical protein
MASSGSRFQTDDERHSKSGSRYRSNDEGRTQRARQFIGIGLLSIVALVFVMYGVFQDDEPEAIVVTGYVGGKLAFFDNPRVIEFLKSEYNLVVKPNRLGSYEQVTKCRPPMDFCWPSSQVAGELLVAQLGSAALGNQIIFNSPIVYYTWTPICDALIVQGVVRQSGDSYYLQDPAKFVEMIQTGVPWSQIGLSQLYGSVTIHTSDPIESNTGNSFAGILANTLNGGQVVDGTSVKTVSPDVVAFFGKLGLLPSTTTELFEQFLTLGMGGAPIIVAYESNLIEHSLLHPGTSTKEFLSANVRTLYPEPTVWSSQPFIPLSENGKLLMEALRRPEIQAIGWENHGFRSAVPGIDNDPSIFGLPGVPPQIVSTMPMPSPSAMLYIMEALGMKPLPIARREEFLI